MRIQISAVALLALTCTACSENPIEWREPEPVVGSLGTAPDIGFDDAHRVVTRPVASVRPPSVANQCPESIRIARDTTGGWYAAWWSLRPDSTADLVVARMADGQPWGPPIRVDSTDVARVGCSRPPPSIDGDGPNVHLAYAMTAREGPGIFASHSMDHGMLFHAPVAVVYGEHIGLTSIAARGYDVVVAYEDPNSNPPRVGLAVSRTQGHLFEHREIVSPPTGDARQPAVALRDRSVAVAWWQSSGANGAAFRLLRLGVFR